MYIAKVADDVGEVLDAVEAACAEGRYAVGYISYEAASGLDSALTHHDPGGLPLAVFAVFEDNHETSLGVSSTALDLSPVISQSDFGNSIRRIKAYLEGGDAYQVNFTHPLRGVAEMSPETVFSFLHQAQPSQYSAFIETEEFAICSVSPELFFELNGTSIRMEPMKGTRPRGRFSREDSELRLDLIGSEKDRAENLMIVDMVRNDLSKISLTGTVRTEELFSIKKFPTVWQKVSTINAETNASLKAIFSALFPCASVTGAPKARTMEIIRELEFQERGVYTGAIGLVKPGRRAKFSVAIRTLTIDKQKKQAMYGVGGGIVWDSDADEEWKESLTKGKILSFESPSFQLLETMLFEPEVGVSLLDFHLERLEDSADYFDFAIDLDIIRKHLISLQFSSPSKLRLMLSSDGHYELEAHHLIYSKVEIDLRLAGSAVNSSNVFLFHKTTNRDVYQKALNSVQNCDDVILWNERDELTETTIANLFLEFDGELITPPLESGLLAGTYRRDMLEKKLVREAVVRKSDLKSAKKIYIANSIRGLVSARLLD